MTPDGRLSDSAMVQHAAISPEGDGVTVWDSEVSVARATFVVVGY